MIMARSKKKIESIAVTALSAEVDCFDRLGESFRKDDKIPFWDGDIFIYKGKDGKEPNKGDWVGRLPVQIKGTEVVAFSEDTREFNVERSAFNVYRKDLGILYFVVEILKNIKKPTTKTFYCQLLPYDIHKWIQEMDKHEWMSISVVMRELKNDDASNLHLLSLNFIQNREKQAHAKQISLDQIQGITDYELSASINAPTNSAFIEHLLQKNPTYFYARGANDISFPILNLADSRFNLSTSISDEVSIGDTVYSQPLVFEADSEYGKLMKFGNAVTFYFNGQLQFSEKGFLNERIEIIDFLLGAIEHKGFWIFDDYCPLWRDTTEQMKELAEKLRTRYEYLNAVNQAFEIMGIHTPVEIDGVDENLLAAVTQCLIFDDKNALSFKNEGVNRLRIAGYSIALFHALGLVKNFFGRDFFSTVKVKLTEKDTGKEIEISPYYSLVAAFINEISNFSSNAVMESIKSLPYSAEAGNIYNLLLLEGIKALDMNIDRVEVRTFVNELADYLNENNGDNISRMNKIQIQKRFGEIDPIDAEWLKEESRTEKDPKMLCGIAILLSDKGLFKNEFAKLDEDMQNEFRSFPIMKLLDESDGF